MFLWVLTCALNVVHRYHNNYVDKKREEEVDNDIVVLADKIAGSFMCLSCFSTAQQSFYFFMK